MDEKKKRLVEEDLTEVGTAQPVPATAQEVAAATPATSAEAANPVPEETVSVTATPQVAAGDSPDSDPLTPPAEGMVPTGWAYPEDLAAAIAMATGDVEPAGTAADAAVTEQPLVTDEPGEGTVPANVPVDVAAPKNEGDLTMEEKQMLLAFRKRKFKEELEADGDKSVEFANPFEAFADETTSEALPEAPASFDEVADTEEEEAETINIDDILASIDAVFGESELDGEACEEDCEEECEECEEGCNEECDEQASIENVADTFGTLSSVLKNLLTDEEAGVKPGEDVDVTKDEITDAFSFLSALEDNLFYNEEEEDEEELADSEEENSEEEEDPEAEEIEDAEESSDDEFSIKESNGIKYPAGSAPKSSAIVSSVAATKNPSSEESTDADKEVDDDYEEDLVRSYEEKSRARREAFLEFRKSMIQRRKEGSKFNEALNTSSTASNDSSSNKKAWSNNTFIEKYNESRKLNWRELFDKGLLG